MTKKVIDVSQWNRVTSWPTVAKNADAVIIRAGYRGYGAAGTLKTDSSFESHITGAIKAGLPVGIYWCSQALSDSEALEEARYCASILNKYTIQYPVYLDSEHMGPGGSGRADKISKARRTQYGLTFCNAMQSYGYKTGLYCSESWYKAEIDGAAFDKAGHEIWIAKYSTVKPKISRYDAWQYTSSARISGIGGSVDVSYFYTDYSTPDYRSMVQKRFGFANETMDYLAKYKHSAALLEKLATKN